MPNFTTALKVIFVIFMTWNCQTSGSSSRITTAVARFTSKPTITPSWLQAFIQENTTSSSSSNKTPAFRCLDGCVCTHCLDSNNERQAMLCLRQGTAEILNSSRSQRLDLCSLSLSRNGISMLANRTFAHLSTLKTLNLDRNKIKVIKKGTFIGLTKLLTLNLDYNKISKLSQGSFAGLSSMTSLSIRFNRLKTWGGRLWKDAPSIVYLNIEGNDEFIAKKKLFHNTTIQQLYHVSISPNCTNCIFRRVNVTREQLQQASGCLYLPTHSFHIMEELLPKYILFKGVCYENITCDYSLTRKSVKLEKEWRNKCWETTLKTRYFEYCLATVTIAANLIVVVVTALSTLLRKNTAFVLVGHMAVCDMFVGVYAAGIAHGHRLAQDSAMFRQWRRSVCPYWRTVFMIGQIVGVLTCLLMTLERYLSIIFCMKPSIRLEKFTATCMIGIFWVIAGVACFLMQVIDRAIITDDYMCLLVRNFENTNSLFISQAVLLLCVFIYTIIIIMYFHIYVYVKRSSQNAGVRRECKLAVRIGTVILSNMVFFVLPNLSIIIKSTTVNYSLDISAEAQSALKVWLPPMCLVFNSCINPFLFALRNDRFQAASKSLINDYYKRVRHSLQGIADAMETSPRNTDPIVNGRVRQNAVHIFSSTFADTSFEMEIRNGSTEHAQSNINTISE